MKKHMFLIIMIGAIFSYALIAYIFFKPTSSLDQIRYSDDRTSEGSQLCTSTEQRKTEVQFYNQSFDPLHRFEFRYEFNEEKSPNQSRLMVLFTDQHHDCIDWWSLSAGERVLSAMRSSGFSILAICTAQKDYQFSTPIQKNKHVYWIYITLQKWMNDVYHKRFGHYPRLYLFGLGAGSVVSSLLCRVLPVQAQILYLAPGDPNSLLLHSDHSREVQNRLITDPTFSNWFYFDYCSKEHSSANNRCPFRHRRKNYFNPIPPTYFVHVKRDIYLSLKHYETITSAMQNDALDLGGGLLVQNNTIKLSVVPPLAVTSDSIRKYFNKWSCKLSSSRLFYEHLMNPSFHEPSVRTCWCVDTNFLYFIDHPDLTRLWSKTEQENYNDYVNDIRLHYYDFCETVCGDTLGHHQMISHYIDDTLQWLDQMDEQRSLYQKEEYLSRTLRLWMYEKDELVQNKTHLTYGGSMNSICARHLPTHQMFSTEYFLQDYFTRLNYSYPLMKHGFVWTRDPLLADYYIIPHDMSCMSYTEYKSSMTNAQLKSLLDYINKSYFIPLLNNVRVLFPYWNMSAGSNHLIGFSNGLNMGSIPDISIQETFRNMITLGYTGFRQDSVPQFSAPIYTGKGVKPVYRHDYDIIIPAFNRLQWINDKPVSSNSQWNNWFEKKKFLFFFAGTVDNSNKFQSVRRRLSLLAKKDVGKSKKYTNITTVGGMDLQTMLVIDGHISSEDYIESIRSSIFLICLEDFIPWSTCLHEAINLGAVPLILAESVVLPFERFIDWRSISTKISVDKVEKIVDIVKNIDRFEDHIVEKLKHAAEYFYAFRWPFSPSDQQYDRHAYLPAEDASEADSNVLHYLSLELRCRRLEQFYGLEWNASLKKSIHAKRQACENHPTICPCSQETTTIATEEYL